MRVLHVISSFGLGGAESVAVELCARLSGEREVEIQAVRKPSPGEHTVAEARKALLDMAGVRWTEGEAPDAASASRSAPFELLSTIERMRPDIVHSHTDVPDFCLSLARRFKRFRVARTIHNTHLWPTRRRLGWLAESAFSNDLVVSINDPTQQAYRDMRRQMRLRPSDYQTIIRNGVNREPTGGYAPDAAARLGADADRFQIGFVGRLDNQKGFDVLLKAVDRLPAELRAAMQLHIIGDGALREQANRAARPGSIFVHGAIPNARALLRAFDLVVMPSRYEGSPLVAMEALMSGVPLLISDVGGLREVLPADWPLKTPVEDADALAAMLAASISGQAGPAILPECWVDQFDAAAMAANYARAYQAFAEMDAQPAVQRIAALSAITIGQRLTP